VGSFLIAFVLDRTVCVILSVVLPVTFSYLLLYNQRTFCYDLLLSRYFCKLPFLPISIALLISTKFLDANMLLLYLHYYTFYAVLLFLTRAM